MPKHYIIEYEYEAEEVIAEEIYSNYVKAEESEEEDEMGSKRFYCYECKFLFSRKSLLDKHLETHPKFQCLSCEFTTLVENELKKHMQLHLPDSKINPLLLECPNCNFSTSRKSSLSNHLRKHTRPFLCKECGNKFTHETYMKAHITLHHRKSTDMKRNFESFSCTVCDYKCSSDAGLQEHIEGHQATPPFICHCSVECSSEANLKSHMVTHTDIKMESSDLDIECLTDFNNNELHGNLPVQSHSYECTDCGHKFDCQIHLKWHLLTHNNKQYYDCSECEFRTIKLFNLKMHEKKHAGKKLMACPECDYKAENEILLVKHTKTHRKNMKPKCCQNNFKKCKGKSELSFICSYCSDDFSSLKKLTKHVQIHNKGNKNSDNKNQLKSHPAILKETYNATKQGNDIKISNKIFKLNNWTIAQDKKEFNEKIACEVNGCTEIFLSQRNLKKHMNNHKNENIYNCNDCDNKFYTKYKLQKHLNNHETHNCMKCDFKYNNLRELSIHEESHITKLEDSTFEVNCAKHLKNDSITSKIVSPVYSIGNKNLKKLPKNKIDKIIKIKCSMCHLTFVTKSGRAKHMDNIHNKKEKKNENMKCSMCNLTFVTKYGHWRHMNIIHLKNKQFSCSICPYKTFLSYRLKQHEVIHKHDRFHCPECDYKCAKNTELIHHMTRTHAMT
ncbi:unnamed protein product [Meganyctiphanes norvegica]|uniref:C2H2-type domain-containing protein n=1 Tax=Meganyctiphanes norvegica TaxID=48144 RepID=A0AAV2PMG9_MEGNR